MATELQPAAGPDKIQEEFLALNSNAFSIFSQHKAALQSAKDQHGLLTERLQEAKAFHGQLTARIASLKGVNFAQTIFENTVKDQGGVNALEKITNTITPFYLVLKLAPEIVKYSEDRLAAIQSDLDAFLSMNRDLLKEAGVKI
jgi:hypothetical protein